MSAPTDKSVELLLDTNLFVSQVVQAGFASFVSVVASVDSSQNVLLATPAEQLRHEQYLVVEHQTGGRGRLDRSWQTQPGQAVMMSFVWDSEQLAFAAELVPIAVGVAVARALKPVVDSVGLKWPNDVMADELKLGGIIASHHADNPRFIVCGVGLNHSLPLERPVHNAGSISECATDIPSREQVLRDVIRNLHLVTLCKSAEVVATYRDLSTTIGQQVRCEKVSGEVLEGIAVDIDGSGQLLIEVDGHVQSHATGDVFHLRSL